MTDELSETMKIGLKRMARKLKTNPAGSCMSEPNENTGRALARRGYIEIVSVGMYPYYTVTDKGRAWIEANP